MKHLLLIVITTALACCSTVRHSNQDAIKPENNESAPVQQIQESSPGTLPPVTPKNLPENKPGLIEVHEKPKPASFYGPEYSKRERIELEGDGYLQVYKKDEGEAIIPSGPYAGLSGRGSSDLLVFSHGKEFKLPDDEGFFSSNGRYLVANSSPGEYGESDITYSHIYDISQEPPAKINTIKHENSYVPDQIFGNVLSADDEYYGGGTGINLYDIETGILLNAYSPYPGHGYSSGGIGWSGTDFFLIFEKRLSPGSWKIAVINNSGVVEIEREIFMGTIEQHLRIEVLEHFEDYSLTLASGYPQRLLVFDSELNLAWKVEAKLPYNQVEVVPGRHVYLVKDKEIECIDLKSGKVNWSFQFRNDEESYVDSSNPSHKRRYERKVTSIKSNPEDGFLLVLTGITHVANWFNEGPLQDPELLIIDDSGSVKKKIDVGPELTGASIVIKNDKALLITDENVYEVNY